MRKTMIFAALLSGATPAAAQLFECYPVGDVDMPEPIYIMPMAVPSVTEVTPGDLNRAYLWSDGWSGSQRNPTDFKDYSGKGR